MLLLTTHIPLLAVACLGWSANTAFAFSSFSLAAVKQNHASSAAASSKHHNYCITSTSLHYSINRRSVFTIIVPVATTFAALFIPPGDDTNEQYRANADEPNNLYYKSKADEEDPLAVFGRSLQQSIPTTTSSTSTDGNDGAQQQGVEQSKNKVTEPQSLPAGGDLGKALLEKQQLRRIDPRTHG